MNISNLSFPLLATSSETFSLICSFIKLRRLRRHHILIPPFIKSHTEKGDASQKMIRDTRRWLWPLKHIPSSCAKVLLRLFSSFIFLLLRPAHFPAALSCVMSESLASHHFLSRRNSRHRCQVRLPAAQRIPLTFTNSHASTLSFSAQFKDGPAHPVWMLQTHKATPAS